VAQLRNTPGAGLRKVLHPRRRSNAGHCGAFLMSRATPSSCRAKGEAGCWGPGFWVPSVLLVAPFMRWARRHWSVPPPVLRRRAEGNSLMQSGGLPLARGTGRPACGRIAHVDRERIEAPAFRLPADADGRMDAVRRCAGRTGVRRVRQGGGIPHRGRQSAPPPPLSTLSPLLPTIALPLGVERGELDRQGKRKGTQAQR
jgi:hypothetical protein